MTETERKALALVNEVFVESGQSACPSYNQLPWHTAEALCRAIEQHEAFKRDVSDAVEAYNDLWRKRTPGRDEFMGHFIRFILPKPVDPLVEAIQEWWDADGYAHIETFRAALAKRGLEVREIEG